MPVTVGPAKPDAMFAGSKLAALAVSPADCAETAKSAVVYGSPVSGFIPIDI
jgi:hypothetical protein